MKLAVILGISTVFSGILLLFYSVSFLASIHAANANKYIAKGDGINALNSIEFASKLSPKVSTYPMMKAEYLNGWVKANPETRSILEPIISREIETAVTKNPLYFRHYIRASRILKDLGYLEEAITLYESSVRMVPNSTKLRNSLALLYIDNQEYDKASNQLEIAVRIVDRSAYSYESFYVASLLAQRKGNYEEAIELLYTSLDVAPNSPICGTIINYLRNVVNDFDNAYSRTEECKYPATS